MRGRQGGPTVAAMLRLLPISLLLVLLATATAQAATVKVPVPAEGQMTVAVASVAKKSSVKAKAPGGIAVTGSVKKGRLGVAVLHRRGVAAGGEVALKVKGKVRGLRTSASAGACRTLAGLLSKPLARAGLAAADLRTAGGAAAAQACGKPLAGGAQAVLDRLGLGAAPSISGASPRLARRSPEEAAAARPTSARTGSTTTATARSTLPASASRAPTPAA